MSNKVRYVLVAVIFYILGLATLPATFLISDPEALSLIYEEQLVKDWGIFESAPRSVDDLLAGRTPDTLKHDPNNHLWVAFPEEGVYVQMEKNPTSGRLESIYFLTRNQGPSFEYKQEGRFGKPECKYSGGGLDETLKVWIDYNRDGIFDKRLANKQMEAFIDGTWVKALGSDKIHVGEKEYTFDVKEGKWILATATTQPATQPTTSQASTD